MENRGKNSTIGVKNTEGGIENRKARVWNIENGGKNSTTGVYNVKTRGE
jgi:hypothetical protein